MSRQVLFLLLFSSFVWANYTEVYKEFTANNAKLHSKLFKDYIKDLAPTFTLGWANAPDDYEPMPISLDIRYFRVTKIDQVSQTAEVVISLQVYWVDRRLAWEPADYGGIPYILVRSESIWQPNISPCDANMRETIDDEKTTMAKIYANGTVNINLNWAISYSCDMVMSNFPFDSHTCRMCFTLNHLTPEEATFQVWRYSNPYMITGKVNNEWALISLQTETVKEKYGTAVYYDCNIVRHPNFWVNLVIIPAYFLGVLIITGLFLGDHEDEVGTSINYGLAVMMSITVIIGILAEGLPKSSSLPTLGYFVLGQLIIVCVAVLFVVLRREIKKLIIFVVKYMYNGRTEKNLLKTLIKQPNRSSYSRAFLRFVRFVLRLIRSNYLAFLLFQLAHALNLIFTLTAFNSEEYTKAMGNTALNAMRLNEMKLNETL